MPIIGLQKRSRELGRIRTGNKGAKGQPQKLTKFRLTGQSKALLEKVAEAYGGEVLAWTPQGGVQQWEVYTEADRLPIFVPPQPVSQWYETWTAGGCIHRCDGETDYITGDDCDNDSKVHQDAKITTRLNVVLKDIEGVGYWRLESHGFNAAVELPNAAEFLAYAEGYVNGWVALEERVTKKMKDGKSETNRFIVPIIEIDVTPAQLMAGEGRIKPPELDGPVTKTEPIPAAIEAGATVDYVLQAQQASTFETVVAIRAKAEKLGHLTPEIDAQLGAIAAGLRAPASAPAQVPDDDGAIDAEIVDEDAAAAADMAWQQCLRVAGEQGLTLPQTKEEYARWSQGQSADDADAEQLEAFLGYLKAGQQVSA